MADISALSDQDLASIAGVTLPDAAPLSVSQNNPGNMKQGGALATFDTPKAGLDAMQHDLMVKISGNSPMMKSHFGEGYQPTIRNIITTWAPPQENDTNKYIGFVAQHAGIDPDAPLAPEDAKKIMAPMVQMEGGQKASSYFGKLMGGIGDAIAPPAEAAQPAQQPQAAPDLSGMSDDELMKAAGIETPPEPTGGGADQFLARIGASVDKLGGSDINRTVMDQGVQGATFGFGDEAESGLAALALSAMNGKPVSENYEAAHKVAQDNLDAEMKRNPGTSIAANLLGGLATGKAALSTASGAAAANSIGSGNLASRLVKGGIAGAASGALYGAGAANEGQRLPGAEQGALLGGALGAAAPAAGAAFDAAKGAIGLPAASEDLKPLAQKALDYGIPLSRTQISDSGFAKTLASTSKQIPFSGTGPFQQRQQAAFNRAVADTIGQKAEKITPEVLNQAYRDTGAKFNALERGQVIAVTPQHLDALASIESEASSALTGDHAKLVGNSISKLLNDIGPDGAIAGEKLGSFRSALTKTLSKVKNDASPYLSDLRDLTMDMTTNNDPAKQALLNQARSEYKNIKTIEPLVAKAAASGGDISPALLRGAVMKSYPTFARGGGGKLGDLANIGQAFLKDSVPDSGTPRRIAAYLALTEGPGTLFSALTGNPTAVLAPFAGMASARGFNTINTSQGAVRRALQGGGGIPGVTALLPGNLASQLLKNHAQP